MGWLFILQMELEGAQSWTNLFGTFDLLASLVTTEDTRPAQGHQTWVKEGLMIIFW